MKRTVKLVLITIAVLGIAGVGTGLYLFNLKSANLANTKPDFVISAADLEKAFETDEKVASGQYINKILEVTGKISSVKPGENSAVSISIETDNPVASVIATFPGIKDPAFFKTGDELTFRGQCSGFLMDVLLNNCAAIIKK
jgi:hypothetical protein